jgi:hypothetical protein
MSSAEYVSENVSVDVGRKGFPAQPAWIGADAAVAVRRKGVETTPEELPTKSCRLSRKRSTL